MARLGGVFFDSSVLLGGLIDLGPASRAAQQVYDLVAAGRLGRPRTAWQCCLEFYSVATRLPEEFRLTPKDAVTLLEQEVLSRLDVFELPARLRRSLLADVAREGVRGGRLYDAHIAAVARASGSRVVVTENIRHFAGLEAVGMRVWSSTALLSELRKAGPRRRS